MKKGMLSMAVVSALVIGNLALVIGDCDAGVPRMMNYQGKLTGATGSLVANGQYDMTFAMYDAETGGTLKWTETWDSGTAPVQVTNGLFNVLLGKYTALDIAFGEDYWLEQQVKYGESYETLLPRQPVASVGYAMRAEKVTDGAITDASISASAAISDTKLATISTAGKVSGSAVSGTLAAVNGSAVTALSASNISSGTLGSTYLPADGYASTYVNAGGDTMTGSLGLASDGLAVGTSQLVVSGGNVGVGTTSPWQTLSIQGTFDGWVAAGETWTYVAADAPAFTFTTGGDKSGKYGVGMRVKLTQTIPQYFIVTKVVYSEPNTTITVYGGTDYTLADAAIANPFYSTQKAPFGFPVDPTKWTVETTDVTQRSQASPTQSAWYNLGALNIALPIGVWNIYYEGMIQLNKSGVTSHDELMTLSTANNNESDTAFSSKSTLNADWTGVVHRRSGTLVLTAKTTYYLLERTDITGGTTLYLRSDQAKTIIRAVCAYL